MTSIQSLFSRILLLDRTNFLWFLIFWTYTVHMLLFLHCTIVCLYMVMFSFSLRSARFIARCFCALRLLKPASGKFANIFACTQPHVWCEQKCAYHPCNVDIFSINELTKKFRPFLQINKQTHNHRHIHTYNMYMLLVKHFIAVASRRIAIFVKLPSNVRQLRIH